MTLKSTEDEFEAEAREILKIPGKMEALVNALFGPMVKEKLALYSFSLSRKALKALQAIADAQHVPVSQLLRGMVANELASYERSLARTSGFGLGEALRLRSKMNGIDRHAE